MVVMVISDEIEKERTCLVRYARDLAGRWTEEKWEYLECSTSDELEQIVRKKTVDMICVDITRKSMLELVKLFRRNCPHAYMILIADARMSPMLYMRPSIGAESLLLRPLSDRQIQEVLSEAVEAFARRFYQPDEKQVFVVEQRGERKLVDYDMIYFFEARQKRVYLNTEMEEYGFYGTLDELEKTLGEKFIRCHRGFLVNKDKIANIYLSQNLIMLAGEYRIPLSRSYKPAIKEYLSSAMQLV